MPENILYYLGAGASAQAMPVIKANSEKLVSLPKAMRKMADVLTENPSFLIKKHTQVPFYTKIAEDLKWLASEGRTLQQSIHTPNISTSYVLPALLLTHCDHYGRKKPQRSHSLAEP